MKQLNRKLSIRVSMAVLVITILLGITATASADQVILPYTFSSGTTISSSQVNSNFQALAQSMPGLKSVPGSGNVTLSSGWQNLASITVTPPVDGILMFFASASGTITQGSKAGGDSWGYSSMSICTTPTSGTGGGPGCTGGGGTLTLDTIFTTAVANYAPRITVPITTIGFVPVQKNTPVTYYLTAAYTDSSSVGSCVVNGSSLTALFIPGGYMP